MKNKRIYMIDIFKYLCAIFVVFFHTVNVKEFYGIEYIIKEVLNIFSKFIVPVEFFFIVSSFLFFVKKPNKEKLFKYLSRLFTIYLLYGILYIGVMTENFSGRSIIYNFLSIIKQVFITGYSWHGWYVPALMYGIILTYILRKNIKNKYLLHFIYAFFVIIALLSSSYFYLFPNKITKYLLKIFGTIGIIRAPIYIYLGSIIADKYINNVYDNNRLKKEVLCWIISFIFCILEINFLNINNLSYSQEITIFKILISYFMLNTILCFDKKIKDNEKLQKITSFLGKCSTMIYFAHMAIIQAINCKISPYIIWGIVIVSLTFLTLLCDTISKRKKFKWINLLF